MRIKVECKIIEKKDPTKTNYSYGIYSLVVNNLDKSIAQQFFSRKKGFRLFTFTNVYLHPEESGGSSEFHFYLSGEDRIVEQFMINITAQKRTLRIDDILFNVKKISILDQLPRREQYRFKGKVIINTLENNKATLLEDILAVEEKLRINAIKKANTLGLDGDIRFKIINPQKCVGQYKLAHLFSWKCILEVTGDYDVVNTVYQCGAGENTASGHGFLWECK